VADQPPSVPYNHFLSTDLVCLGSLGEQVETMTTAPS